MIYSESIVVGECRPFQRSTFKVKLKKLKCFCAFMIIFYSEGDTFRLTHPFLYGTRPHPVCTHTHTQKNFVLLFWPPPLLVFILICMRGVHTEVSRAYWSCASSVKHTWTCKTTGTHKQHGAEWGTRQSGGWTHQHFKLSNGWRKKEEQFDIKNPSSSRNSEQNKRTKHE